VLAMSGLCNGGAADAFALVAYLPDPLGSFVNRVRRELAPGCRLRAHITILPPRQLACAAPIASRELQEAIAHVRSFRVEAEKIQVFPISDVVYLSIGAGLAELQELHARLNYGRCCASEAWSYHPHVTLAQDLPGDAVGRMREIAERRWREYSGPRDFTVDKLAFVQGNPERGWMDLEAYELLSPVLA
jgi:2'-5' RNA ligase